MAFDSIVIKGAAEHNLKNIDLVLPRNWKTDDERGNWLNYLRVDPRVDALRADPRFQNLPRRVRA